MAESASVVKKLTCYVAEYNRIKCRLVACA